AGGRGLAAEASARDALLLARLAEPAALLAREPCGHAQIAARPRQQLGEVRLLEGRDGTGLRFAEALTSEEVRRRGFGSRIDAQHGAIAQHHRTVDEVLQLAHVSRPILACEVPDGVGMERHRHLAVLVAEAPHEGLGEQRHVVARSRSGGSPSTRMFRRKRRSWRYRPSAASAARSTLLDATTRTLAPHGAPPTGRYWRSSRNRSSATCPRGPIA